jgi:hypothetical protein
VAEPTRRGRKRTTILSMVLLLVVSAKRSDHQPGHEPAGAGIMSTLSVIPEAVDEVAQLLNALTGP